MVFPHIRSNSISHNGTSRYILVIGSAYLNHIDISIHRLVEAVE